jgi:hypothetical protein
VSPGVPNRMRRTPAETLTGTAGRYGLFLAIQCVLSISIVLLTSILALRQTGEIRVGTIVTVSSIMMLPILYLWSMRRAVVELQKARSEIVSSPGKQPD